MTKILTARKYKTNNPFTKYMQKNIEERYLVYHEDWKKFEQVKQKLIKEGWQVKVWDVVEEESEDAYKQYQERSMYFTAPSKTILAQLCGKYGSKTEHTGL